MRVAFSRALTALVLENNNTKQSREGQSVKNRISGASLTIAALLFSGAAMALPITESSGDGNDVIVTSVNPGAVTTITPPEVWGDVSDDAGLAPGTAKWISFANTGAGGSVAPNTPDRTDTS